MPLTSAQIAILGNAIDSETDPVFVGYRNEGATGLMTQWLNQPATPSHAVWSSVVNVGTILDAISFDVYTPTALPTDATATIYTARILAIQTKQMNLQNMLIGRESINCSRSRVREGLLDAVVDIPSGANGALRSAAGASGARLLNALTRPATRGEKIFSDTSTTTGTVTAFNLGYEGFITDAEVVLAINT